MTGVAATPFSIGCVAGPDTLRVTMAGELDLHAVPLLRRELIRFDAMRVRSIVFDLRSLEFIDLAGARALLGAYERPRWSWVLFVAPRPAVRRLFGLLGLGYLLMEDPHAENGVGPADESSM